MFAGKTALVTGGSRGIGRAIVRMLAAEGCAVAFTYKSRADAAEELAAEIVTAGGAARPAGWMWGILPPSRTGWRRAGPPLAQLISWSIMPGS